MRGNIRKRSEGSWRLRYDGPARPDGRRRQITETVRGARKDAERVLRARLLAFDTGVYVERARETLAAFLERWLATYAATNTSLRTQDGYRSHLRRYILPTIGQVAVQGIKAPQIQAVYAGMLERGLSASTCNHVHRILHEALGHAVKWGALARNPADAVTPPRPERRELKVWDAAQVRQFLEAAQASPFRDVYHLAVLTGMRRSELTGLKWDAVDLAAGRLSVVRTLQRITGHKLVESQPKTAKSRRSIALSPTAVDLLHAIRGRQLAWQLERGDLWHNIGHVFTEPDGRPVDGGRLSKDFQRWVKAAGLPPGTLHGLRHAHATLLLSAGVHAKVVSERLGHSNIGMTLDTYSHVLPNLQAEAARAVDAALGAP